MPVSALSLVRLCAEQKLVPELPMRQLSRTLSGVAASEGAAPARAATAAAMANPVLPISILQSIRIAGTLGENVASAGNRLVEVGVQLHRARADEAERGVDIRLVAVALPRFLFGLLLLLLLVDRVWRRDGRWPRDLLNRPEHRVRPLRLGRRSRRRWRRWRRRRRRRRGRGRRRRRRGRRRRRRRRRRGRRRWGRRWRRRSRRRRRRGRRR